jgi:BrnA antitoxin of type II toxin-antitoxin system
VEVVDWFKAQGRFYQSRMNAVLCCYMEVHRGRVNTNPAPKFSAAAEFRPLGNTLDRTVFLTNAHGLTKVRNPEHRLLLRVRKIGPNVFQLPIFHRF